MAEKIWKIGGIVDYRDEVSICRYPPDIFNLPNVLILQRNQLIKAFMPEMKRPS
jgi:hypothetical protein